LRPKAIRYQQVARQLRGGQLLAHHTATLPGVAALPEHPVALARLRRFKQRQSPFLILISPTLRSRLDARRWITWRSPTMRQWIRRCWPGTTTLLLPATLRAPSAAQHHGVIALRMVDDPATQRLLVRCGGTLYSSSLNRQGGTPRMLAPRLRRRWNIITLQGSCGSGQPSSIINLCKKTPQFVR